MVDLVSSTLAVAALTAVGLVVLLALTVAPFFLTLQGAERRGDSTGRWGAVALASIGLGLVLTVVLRRAGVPTPALVLPLALTWGGPLALKALADRGSRLGGRAGAHEA